MDKLVLQYDERLYPRAAIIKSAYRFLDEAYFHLDIQDGKYIVEISGKEGAEINVTKELFDEEMLIQSARFLVAEKTKDIRKMTMARAFASTLIDDENDSDEISEEVIASEEILKDWFENE